MFTERRSVSRRQKAGLATRSCGERQEGAKTTCVGKLCEDGIQPESQQYDPHRPQPALRSQCSVEHGVGLTASSSGSPLRQPFPVLVSY